jgi:hypothetical protein
MPRIMGVPFKTRQSVNRSLNNSWTVIDVLGRSEAASTQDDHGLGRVG